MSGATPYLSVVIPAYNEERRIGSTLGRVSDYLRDRGDSHEVIVVDDGSDDDTAAVVAGFESAAVELVRLPENRGKGAALRAGVGTTSGERVLLCDADLSAPIEDLERLEPHLDEAEVVLGSRAVEGSEISVRQPLYRELMGKLFNLLLRGLGMVRYRDTQCGFKLLDGEVARQLFSRLTVDRFAYDVELVVEAERAGYRVVEVGVRWRDEPQSRVHPVWDSLRMLVDVVRIRARRSGG